MVALNQVIADGANAIVNVAIRQASTALSSAVSTATTDPFSPVPSTTVPSTTIGTSTPTSTMTGGISFTPSATGTAPVPTPTPTDGGSPGGNNSPLLFFVALGFGVVFTNLWIIVGVKYCFRYNARNRQLRGLDENGEPINLDNMPQRPHRRRREKKLMTMDEVNEKFPMTKYKTWVSTRAREGLPTAGGVSVHPSRANSVRSVQGIVPELAAKERDSVDVDGRPQTAAAGAKAEERATGNTNVALDSNTNTMANTPGSGNVTTDTALTSTQTIASVDPKDHDRHASDDEDDDEHINAALPPELLEGPGDTCAICIDTLEDDDDIRGLTCGHAFHAVCLDPWLTNRRACCPLCKADYYTPKPRPPPTEGETTTVVTGAADPSRNNGRMNMPRNPTRSFNPFSRRNATRTAGGADGGARGASTNPAAEAMIYGQTPRSERQARRQPEMGVQGNNETQEGLMSRLGRRVPRFNIGQFGRSRNEPTPQAAETTASGANGGQQATPSQLEAGVRPTPATAGN
ncbi:hypothetical protein Micbo1qcDRAFT_162968 [Microdochium bolleyi]|uniref:RING-type domain-containing protein n=1 Tax=Microdochium bolleyi TaxID=196109 RepID=A0A136J230_9PEZI|nr:hypothetical protein Micbo1qcDRAFT_162968 [Microdochium bolleyi]